jgi:hypothetical protein
MAISAQWNSNLSDFPSKNRHKLIRCPAVRLRPYVILSDKVQIARIHWASRRSIPCPGEDSCELCQKQHPTPKGYLAVWNPETNEQAVLEVTPPTFDAIGAFRTLYNTLRGATIALTRSGTKDNGRMSANLQPSGIPPSQLPQAIDVTETMEELWAQPNKGERHRMEAPRDEIGGHKAVEELQQKIKEPPKEEPKEEQTPTNRLPIDWKLKPSEALENLRSRQRKRINGHKPQEQIP